MLSHPSHKNLRRGAQRAPRWGTQHLCERRMGVVLSHPFRKKPRKGWGTEHLWERRMGVVLSHANVLSRMFMRKLGLSF